MDALLFSAITMLSAPAFDTTNFCGGLTVPIPTLLVDAFTLSVFVSTVRSPATVALARLLLTVILPEPVLVAIVST